MITTSEVAVSLTIDNDEHLSEIVEELKTLGNIEIEKGNTIICVVGKLDHSKSGLVARILESINNIPIKMISYGASNRNVTFLISSENKKEALQFLNNHLF